MTVLGTVATINRFPVKSMQGESVTEAELDANGIAGDRTWALRDVETDRLVSAKRPRLWKRMFECRATGTGDDVVVELPGGARFAIGDPALPGALGELFGREVVVEASVRAGQGLYASDWPELEGVDLAGEIDLPTNLIDGTSFVDVAALHLLTTASLAAIAAVGPPTAGRPERYRPGLLLDTPELDGYVEDGWNRARLRVGEVELEVGEPTPRCVMTTLAQPGLHEDREVLTALAAHHRVTGEFGSFACLGVYARVVTPGTVRAGDPVELV
jgi:uncharacterized protein YcbX